MEKQTNTNFRRFCATTGGRMGERERKHSCCPGCRADPFRQTFLRVDERLPGALPFLFAVLAPFAVRITGDTPLCLGGFGRERVVETRNLDAVSPTPCGLSEGSPQRFFSCFWGFHESRRTRAMKAVKAPKRKGARGPKPFQGPRPLQRTPARREAGRSERPSMAL